MSRRLSEPAVAVLSALLDAGSGWLHGYDLSKATGIASGTLYPVLIRLAEQGLLEEQWEPPVRPGRPPRHVYRVRPDASARATALLEPAGTRRDGLPVPAR